MKKKLNLSPTSLNLFRECPRCFYLEKKMKISRPAGPFPSLPSGMDAIIKKRFDAARVDDKSMPPELKSIKGKLFKDIEKLNIWRNWRLTDLKFETPTLIFSGAIDDCIIEDDGAYAPLDYKTRGFALKEDSAQHYVFQMSAYALLFKGAGFKVSSNGYLIFYIPDTMSGTNVSFHTEVVRVPIDIQDVIAAIKRAEQTLTSSTMPAPGIDCVFCKYKDEVLIEPPALKHKENLWSKI